jgi:hypothetical protein
MRHAQQRVLDLASLETKRQVVAQAFEASDGEMHERRWF